MQADEVVKQGQQEQQGKPSLCLIVISMLLNFYYTWHIQKIDLQWHSLNRAMDCYEDALKDAIAHARLRRIALMMRRQEMRAKVTLLQSQHSHSTKNQPAN